MPTSRRQFMQQSLLASAAFVLPQWLPVSATRKFTLSLSPGSVGIQGNMKSMIALAKKHGFEAITPFAEELAAMSPGGRAEIRGLMESEGLTWDAAGIPVEFRQGKDRFLKDMMALPKVAAALAEVGATRMNTWIMPLHDSLTYLQNFNQHRDRLRNASLVLQDHGIRFGLEYVGPQTLRYASRYVFIHSMKETRELIDAIGLPNVGLVLDSFHWFTANETEADLLTLSDGDVVTCDLNDGVAGRDYKSQIDGERNLPLASGVIDVKTFLGALVKIGYTGPVRAEPFNKALNALENEEAAAATAKAMKAAFALI